MRRSWLRYGCDVGAGSAAVVVLFATHPEPLAASLALPIFTLVALLTDRSLPVSVKPDEPHP